MNLTMQEKIIKAKIELQREQPFFSYLLMNMNLKENKDVESMAVDINSDLYYNKDFVEALSFEKLKGVLIHETLHLALSHLIRLQEKDLQIFNIATDVVTNCIITNNNILLPNINDINGLFTKKFKVRESDLIDLIPKNNELELFGVHLKDIDKKSAEKIYDEIYYKAKNKINFKEGVMFVSGKGRDKIIGNFDEHRVSENKDSKGLSKEQKEAINKWKKLLVEAVTISKLKGNIPSGMERSVEELLEEKINWKHLLYKYITKQIPYDYSYSKPSKRSYSVGVYMPHIVKENVEITAIVDTSGSVSQKELTEFLSEVVHIAKSFNNLKMRVISCDCAVQTDDLVENGNIPKILDLKVKGGGGTSFVVPLDYLKENYPNTKLVVFFTDGYGDKISNYPFSLMWVLCKNGSDDLIKCCGEVIKLEE